LFGVYQFFLWQIKGNFQVLWNFMTLTFLPAGMLLVLLACGLFCGLAGSLLFKFEENKEE
jgi:H+/Cl- antiporter ClcA